MTNLRTPALEEILAAAAQIVRAFAANDGTEYFTAFAPDASFVFHTEPGRLDARAEYEALWQGWIAEGWRVLKCVSTEQLAQAYPGGGIFSHTVATTVDLGNGTQDSYRERESIVFRTDGDGLLAVHEHLSTLSALDDAGER
ncbi:nuclear transport factor 2 family protein [Galactobacter caseinivorans]|uniref:DUF4440 domain-containing protein n=1 Tax=Galactobacter caseinivorans TaxID=2676123 RepID=A0A496PJ70_9MICC|nr:nuclear transport factor 2 family protein [Galactobacter caseinivorans]RKW70509.1 DUF4440 domain-containing protein [Galactobacter caseinivorans]